MHYGVIYDGLYEVTILDETATLYKVAYADRMFRQAQQDGLLLSWIPKTARIPSISKRAKR